MKIDIPYKFGDIVYLINDKEQHEYLIHRIFLEPKGKIVFELMNDEGDFVEVPETFVSTEFDQLKKLKKDEEE